MDAVGSDIRSEWATGKLVALKAALPVWNLILLAAGLVTTGTNLVPAIVAPLALGIVTLGVQSVLRLANDTPLTSTNLGVRRLFILYIVASVAYAAVLGIDIANPMLYRREFKFIVTFAWFIVFSLLEYPGASATEWLRRTLYGMALVSLAWFVIGKFDPTFLGQLFSRPPNNSLYPNQFGMWEFLDGELIYLGPFVTHGAAGGFYAILAIFLSCLTATRRRVGAVLLCWATAVIVLASRSRAFEVALLVPSALAILAYLAGQPGLSRLTKSTSGRLSLLTDVFFSAPLTKSYLLVNVGLLVIAVYGVSAAKFLPANDEIEFSAGAQFDVPSQTKFDVPIGTKIIFPEGKSVEVLSEARMHVPAGTKVEIPAGTRVPDTSGARVLVEGTSLKLLTAATIEVLNDGSITNAHPDEAAAFPVGKTAETLARGKVELLSGAKLKSVRGSSASLLQVLLPARLDTSSLAHIETLRYRTILSRELLWKFAIGDFLRSPLVGIGATRFEDNPDVIGNVAGDPKSVGYIHSGSVRYLDVPLLHISIGDYIAHIDESAHNSYLNVLAEGGLVFFVLAVFMYFKLYRTVRSVERPEVERTGAELALGVRQGLVATAVASMATNSLFAVIPLITIFSVAGFLLACQAKERA